MTLKHSPDSTEPGRIALLPRNKVGYAVPWFVATIDGTPDFRVIKPGAIEDAQRRKLCWVCGVPFQRQEDRAFVIGPMCAVNGSAPNRPRIVTAPSTQPPLARS